MLEERKQFWIEKSYIGKRSNIFWTANRRLTIRLWQMIIYWIQIASIWSFQHLSLNNMQFTLTSLKSFNENIP